MKLIKKEFLDFEGYVYNIEVEDNHNYYAEDILVSNCYLGCTEEGKHADLTNPIFDTVHAGTEMAINGNDLTHPGLEDFLVKMKNKNVFVNITVNQKHLYPNLSKLKQWQENHLIWGIGISLTDSTDPQLFESISQLKNVIIHIIDGCTTKADLDNLSNHDIKILILGFKHKGRGLDYYNENKDFVDSNIEFLKCNLLKYASKFAGIGFDNLAVEDLEIQKQVPADDWEVYNMGSDGQFTFYFDSVENKFAVSSTDNIYYNILDTFDNMFKFIRQLNA